jgi:hypothetical protein
LALALLASLTTSAAHAQTHRGHESPRASDVQLGARAIALLTYVTPAALGRDRTEAYLTQPMLFGDGRWNSGKLRVAGALNFERFTLLRGELDPGIYGEGYIDRRHPHTLLHELMLVAAASLGAVNVSLAAGKGFVPFGSDDPMTRRFVKYPVNHHLAQILERAMVTSAVRYGRLAVEGAVFNGDEPEGPSDEPNLERFADSWSVRGTVVVSEAVELSASEARVASPEDAAGFGLDHRQHHVALRFSRPVAGAIDGEALIEYARSDEFTRSRRAFRFSSLLGEGAIDAKALSLAIRIERTTRPDEMRLNNIFRSPRPLLDLDILGRSLWESVALQFSHRLAAPHRPMLEPFVEMQVSRVRSTLHPTVFETTDFYGADRLWMVSAGMRVSVAGMAHRMGRYGVADPTR